MVASASGGCVDGGVVMGLGYAESYGYGGFVVLGTAGRRFGRCHLTFLMVRQGREEGGFH